MYYGCQKEKSDSRDYRLVSKFANYPDRYKITMPEVKDQGIVNSCVAHSLATFMEEWNPSAKYSVGFIYGYRPLGYYQGEGMYPREALKTLQKIGDVEYDDFSHNKELPEIKSLVDKDINRLSALASLHRIESYARIYSELDIKSVLLKETPVPISIPVRGTLELENNVIQITNKPVTGYHMIVIYGWCEEGWLIQNSWGKHWGINGTAILPFEYEIDSAWAISTMANTVEVKPKWTHKIIAWFKKLFTLFDYIFSS